MSPAPLLPPEGVRAYALTPNLCFNRIAFDAVEPLGCHPSDDAVMGPVPNVFVLAEVLAPQAVIRTIKYREGYKHPFPRLPYCRARVLDVFQAVPKGQCSTCPGIQILVPASITQPRHPGGVHVVPEGLGPRLHKLPTTDSDIEQEARVVPGHQIHPSLSQRAPYPGVSVLPVLSEVLRVVGH